MKQPEDDKTIDMLGPLKARPGRPQKTRTAEHEKRDAAKRQADRRARLRAEGKGFLSAVVDADLLQQIDKIQSTTGREKNVIIENLLRHALSTLTASSASHSPTDPDRPMAS